MYGSASHRSEDARTARGGYLELDNSRAER